jgi:hypothetical protein
VDYEARVALLRRHWEFAAVDQDVAHEIYHDDAVLEFPQSGERFEGVEKFREWRRLYPAELAFQTRQIRGEGDLWVVENSIRYGDGEWQPTVNILQFEGDKVARETIYITESWDPPDWRAPWRSAP